MVTVQYFSEVTKMGILLVHYFHCNGNTLLSITSMSTMTWQKHHRLKTNLCSLLATTKGHQIS